VGGVSTRRSLSGRLLGYGTLVVETDSGAALEFADVPAAERVQALLHQGAGS
jgi:hypothetical protein